MRDGVGHGLDTRPSARTPWVGSSVVMTPWPCLWGWCASPRAHSYILHSSMPALRAQPHARCGQRQHSPKALSVWKKSQEGKWVLGAVPPSLLCSQCYTVTLGRDTDTERDTWAVLFLSQGKGRHARASHDHSLSQPSWSSRLHETGKTPYML